MADRQRRINAGRRGAPPEGRERPIAGRRARGAEEQDDGARPRVRRRGVAEDEGQVGNRVLGEDQQAQEEPDADGAQGNDPVVEAEQVVNEAELLIVIDPLFDMAVVPFRFDMFAKFEESRGGMVVITSPTLIDWLRRFRLPILEDVRVRAGVMVTRSLLTLLFVQLATMKTDAGVEVAEGIKIFRGQWNIQFFARMWQALLRKGFCDTCVGQSVGEAFASIETFIAAKEDDNAFELREGDFEIFPEIPMDRPAEEKKGKLLESITAADIFRKGNSLIGAAMWSYFASPSTLVEDRSDVDGNFMLLLKSARAWVKAANQNWEPPPDRVLGSVLASMLSTRFRLPGLLMTLQKTAANRYLEAVTIMHYNGGDPDAEGKMLIKERFRVLLECEAFKAIKKVVGNSTRPWEEVEQLATGFDLYWGWGSFDVLIQLERELRSGRWLAFLDQVEHSGKKSDEKIKYILEGRKESKRMLTSFQKGGMISSDGSVGSTGTVGGSMMHPSEQTVGTVIRSNSFLTAVSSIDRVLEDIEGTDKQQRVLTIVLRLDGYVSLFLKKMTGHLVSDSVHDIFRRMNVVAPVRKDIGPYQLLFGQALVEAYCKYNHQTVPSAAKCWKLPAGTTEKILNGEFADMILENELLGAVHNAVLNRVGALVVKKENRFLEETLTQGLQEVVGDFFVFIGLGAADHETNKASFASLMQNTMVGLRSSSNLSQKMKDHALRNGNNGVQDIMNLAMADAASLWKRRFVTPDLAYLVDPNLFIPENSLVYELLKSVARVSECRSMMMEVFPLHDMFAATAPASSLYEEKADKECKGGKGKGKGAGKGNGRVKGNHSYNASESKDDGSSGADKFDAKGLIHWNKQGKVGFGKWGRQRYFDIKNMRKYLVSEHKMEPSEASKMCFPVGLGMYKDKALPLCQHRSEPGHENMHSKYHDFPMCKDVDGKMHSFGAFVRIGTAFCEDF